MASTDGKMDQLRSVPLFEKLGGRQLEAVGRVADTVDLPAGKVLMRQGDMGAEMFVLVAGGAQVERAGREAIDVGPGTILGEMSLVAEAPRVATVTLTEPSTLIVISHRDFHALLDDSPEILRGVFDSLASRIRWLEADTPH